MTFWPSTLPPDPLFDAITARVLAAAADRTDKEWKGMSDKPSGVAASQAAAADIGYAMQMVEGFEPKRLPQWEMVGRDPDGTPIYRNNWGTYDPWIPVGERLPEEEEEVLACWVPRKDGMACAVIRNLNGKVCWTPADQWTECDPPKWWMPLPEPPSD